MKQSPRFGAFIWHEDPRYKLSEAVKVFVHASGAEKWVRSEYENGRAYVVRELRYCNPRGKNPLAQKDPYKGGSRLEFIKQAARLYHDFTGHPEMEIHKVKIPNLPKAVAVFGELDALEYTCVRDGKTELYRHQFSHKAKPLFCVSPDGKQIIIIGGKYRVTDRGIEDKI
jgi:hypothetical protein